MSNKKQTPFLLAVLFIGFSYTYYFWWIAEDAYISFRYARNLVEGHGLVFNPGEKVEGYTNFLWTLLLAPGLALQMTPETISLILGLIFSVISLTFLFLIHQKIFEKGSVPAFLFALAMNYTWACFSTSGLETSLLSALLAASFYFLAKGDSGLNYAVIGALQALAVMTRPDAVLAFGVIAVYITIRSVQLRQIKNLALLILPFILLFVPYFLWRYNYYGYFFPNTFYAKAASEPYYRQGLTYVLEFAQRYSLWAFVFLAIVIILQRNKLYWLKNHFFLVITAFCLIHLFYIVRIGGDFMEGRFLIPVLPWIYFALEYLIRGFLKGLALTCALILLIATSAIDRPIIEPRTIKNNIADERTWVPVIELWLREGYVLGKNLPAETVVATDAIGAFGYASRLPIIDTLGLTDATIAHLPVKKRTRPGHEKIAPLEYLKKRNVAVIRDGMGIYRSDTPPDWAIANNRYYLLTNKPEVRAAFEKSKVEIETQRVSSRQSVFFLFESGVSLVHELCSEFFAVNFKEGNKKGCNNRACNNSKRAKSCDTSKSREEDDQIVHSCELTDQTRTQKIIDYRNNANCYQENSDRRACMSG
jgi:arabinofuranosyltransferase